MANWLSVESAAKKYGVTEKEINEWIRLRYIASSSLHDEPDVKNGLFVDIEEIEFLLRINATASLPDDETTLRVPVKQFESLITENKSLQDFNDEILEFIYFYRQREERLNKGITKLAILTNKMQSLSVAMTRETECTMYKRSKYLWAILRHFFKKR